MIRIKHIATMLALIGSISAVNASEIHNAAGLHQANPTVVNSQKDNIEFMEDKNLAEVQGAFKIKLGPLLHLLQYHRNPAHADKSGSRNPQAGGN